MLADRVNGFAVLIVVACVATLCCPTPLPGWILGTVAGMGAACLLGLARLAAVALAAQTAAGASASDASCWMAPSCVCATAAAWLCVTLLSLVVQLANVVLAWLIGEGLGLPVPPLYYGVLIPLVSLLTLLPISLNGMGLREAGTVLLLAPLHISEASAVTLSLLIFAVYTAASLMGGVVYLFGRRDPLSAVRCPPTTTAESEKGIAESRKGGVWSCGPCPW